MEVKKARQALAEARKATKPAEALCDLTTACRMAEESLPIDMGAGLWKPI